MDNYQRLFNETRPQNDGVKGIGLEELENMTESEWVRNLLRGVNSYNEKDLNSAIDFLDKAIQEKPDNPHLYKVRANVKEEAGDAQGAIFDYKRALFISGSDWYATYNQIAINYLNRKEFDSALAAFDIAIELKLQLQKSVLDEGMTPYTIDGVVMKVDFEKMYTNRANVKLNLQDFQGCSDDCQAAIKANPEYSNSYFIYGLLCLTAQKNDKAYQALKIAERKGHTGASDVLNQFFQ